MSNGRNQEETKKSSPINSKYRPLLKKVTPRYQDALDRKEGLNDWSRALNGKRILQRLNRGPMYNATRYSRPTIGGLEPPGIPKMKNRQTLKPPDAGTILRESKNWQKIKRHVPPLGTHNPKPVKILRHFKPEKSVLKVKPNAPLDPKYHWKFPPTIINRSRPSPPPATHFQKNPTSFVNPNQPSTLRQMAGPLMHPIRSRPIQRPMQNPVRKMARGLTK